MRTPVVFPAPLGPSRPNTVPSWTSRSIPLSACTSQKDFAIPSVLMMGADMVGQPTDVPGHPEVLSYPCPTVLELIDLRRRFGDPVALDGVSFEVAEGH